MAASHPAAFVVVRGDETGVGMRLEPRVDDHDRYSAPDGRLDRAGEAARVERRQHDGVDAAADEVLDDLDLHLAVVLLLRALPDDVHAELLSRLFGARMDGFPELVGRALGDDGDLEAFACGSGILGGAPAADHQEHYEKQEEEARAHEKRPSDERMRSASKIREMNG